MTRIRTCRREVSPVEVTQDCLARIERLNPVLNAFITILAESAMAEARRAEAEILRGEWRGALHGVPPPVNALLQRLACRAAVEGAAAGAWRIEELSELAGVPHGE